MSDSCFMTTRTMWMATKASIAIGILLYLASCYGIYWAIKNLSAIDATMLVSSLMGYQILYALSVWKCRVKHTDRPAAIWISMILVVCTVAGTLTACSATKLMDVHRYNSNHDVPSVSVSLGDMLNISGIIFTCPTSYCLQFAANNTDCIIAIDLPTKPNPEGNYHVSGGDYHVSGVDDKSRPPMCIYSGDQSYPESYIAMLVFSAAILTIGVSSLIGMAINYVTIGRYCV